MRSKLLALTLVAGTIAAVAALAGSSDRFAYIYKRGNDSIMRINGTIESIERMAKRWSGDYIWVNRNGKEWLIRDAAVLADARKAFAAMEALEPQMEAAEARLKPFEEQAEEIEDRLDDLSDRLEDDESLEAQVRETERQLRAIEVKMRDAEAAMERIEAEMDRREEVAEAQFEKLVLRAIEAGKAQRVD